MYNIECPTDDPYGEVITEFLKKEFPVLIRKTDASLLNLITDAIMATGQTRYGPLPSPESQVAIRNVITHWIDMDQPIKFLVPWGSEKPNGTGLDIAELFALKQLSALHDRIAAFYRPGASFNIRVEDASAPYLFFDRVEKARAEAALYTNAFKVLPAAVGLHAIIHILPESTLVTESIFNNAADEILPYIERHLRQPYQEQPIAELATRGFTQPLSDETINFYLARYEKLYPTKTSEQRRHILARYFASAATRHHLHITGAEDHWQNQFIELSFAQPMPGIPLSRALRRLYYRTMPSTITTNHMPPWRAKGYLKINHEVKASLTSFNNKDLQFNLHYIIIKNNEYSVSINADYIITV